MNKQQRMRNHLTAERLSRIVRQKQVDNHICENCGELGGHWIRTGMPRTLADILEERPETGFWTCPKYYGLDGRRLPEHTDQDFSHTNIFYEVFQPQIS